MNNVCMFFWTISFSRKFVCLTHSLRRQSIVAWASLVEQVLSESILIGWKDTYCAKRALHCTIRLGSNALVPVKVLILKHCVALVTMLVFLLVLTLFSQVIVQGLNLDDLLALPAGREHWTLLPVMYIDWLVIEAFIVAFTKVASLLILRLALRCHSWSEILLLWRRKILCCHLTLIWCLRGSLSWSAVISTWPYICLNNRLILLFSAFLVGHDKIIISSGFSQHLLNLVNLGLS